MKKKSKSWLQCTQTLTTYNFMTLHCINYPLTAQKDHEICLSVILEKDHYDPSFGITKDH